MATTKQSSTKQNEETVTEEETAPKQEVAAKSSAGLPADVGDLDALGGAGFENADADSFSIPFLNVLQKMSPQVDKTEGAYIQGAEPGMVINTVSNELFDAENGGLYVIPVQYRRAYTKWVSRDDGGGFLGEISVDEFNQLDGLTRDGSKFVDGEGHEYVDTRYHYVLTVKADGSFEPALITMSSTQIKKSRNIMTRLQSTKLRSVPGYSGNKPSETAPMYLTVLKLVTVPEKNDQGSWYGWAPKFDESRLLDLNEEQDRELFNEAKSFREQLMSGQAKEQQPDQDTVAGSDEARDY